MSIPRAITLAMAFLALITLSAAPASAELKVNIGGFIKLDALFSDRITNAGVNRLLPTPSTIAFTEGPSVDRPRADNGSFLADVRESRFNITATDKFSDVALKGFIEVDFFGGTDAEANQLVSNSAVVRLRHAIAEGKVPLAPGTFTLLVGQFWDAFGYLPDLGVPPSVVFGANPAGNLFSRQPQLKLTYGLPFGKDTLNLIGAVQANSVNFSTVSPVRSALFDDGSSAARSEGQDLPAFIGKLQWLGSLFRAEVSGVVSRAKGIAPGNGRDEDETVYGLQGTVNVPIGPLTLYAHADNLNGINRLAVAPYPDAVFKGAGKDVATINTLGALGGLSYQLTPALSAHGSYGIRFPDSGSSGHSGLGRLERERLDLVRQQAVLGTVLYKFWQRFQVGVEYERIWVDAFRNNHGEVNIYHGAIWYFF